MVATETAAVELKYPMPGPTEYFPILYEAEKPCVCTDEMRKKKGAIAGTKGIEEVLCVPCCARGILNGIASLSRMIKRA